MKGREKWMRAAAVAMDDSANRTGFLPYPALPVRTGADLGKSDNGTDRARPNKRKALPIIASAGNQHRGRRGGETENGRRAQSSLQRVASRTVHALPGARLLLGPDRGAGVLSGLRGDPGGG